MRLKERRETRRKVRRARVLLALSDGQWHYVTGDLEKRSGVKWGIYTTLYELEEKGLVEARFEDGPYPRRRQYRVAS